MGNIFLPLPERRQFQVWTDLYVCLCLRKVALDLSKTKDYKPLFAFLDPEFDADTIKFLGEQHFMATKEPFRWSPDIKPTFNSGVKEFIRTAAPGDHAKGAQVSTARMLWAIVIAMQGMARSRHECPAGQARARCVLHAGPGRGR
jgi:hypothetical protein